MQRTKKVKHKMEKRSDIINNAYQRRQKIEEGTNKPPSRRRHLGLYAVVKVY